MTAPSVTDAIAVGPCASSRDASVSKRLVRNTNDFERLHCQAMIAAMKTLVPILSRAVRHERVYSRLEVLLTAELSR